MRQAWLLTVLVAACHAAAMWHERKLVVIGAIDLGSRTCHWRLVSKYASSTPAATALRGVPPARIAYCTTSASRPMTPASVGIPAATRPTI